MELKIFVPYTLYRSNTSEDNFLQANYDKLLHMGNKASHIVITIMQRGNLPKIPVWEEIAATACSIQNMLLTASAMGICSFWSTGGMAQQAAMKNYLQLGEEDLVMGVIYLGYSDTEPNAKRFIPLSDKVKWVND